MTTVQSAVDERNAEFWDELCGTRLAQSLGIHDHSPESVRRFDEAFMAMYPYLPRQLPAPARPGETLLEIGLGFGTVGERLAAAGFAYHGLDIAPGPVAMMRERLRRLGQDDADGRVVQGSALEIPHPDAAFDHVVSIGCLHHTGDLSRAVSEVHRVLRPGGRAMVMLYNRHSLRQLLLHWGIVGGDGEEAVRAAYDANTEGDAAPETVFVTARQVRDELFARFAEVRVERHNFDATRLFWLGERAVWFPRRLALPTLARVMGLDLYVHARR